MFFLLKKSKYPIGLDLSDLSIKITQLGSNGDRIKIKGIGRADIPTGIVEKGEIINKDALLEILNNLINKPQYGSITSKSIVASLPESKTFIKLIDIEKTPNKLSDIIESEIEKHIPLPLKDMYYDWQIISETNNSYSVLVGAATQEIVDQYIDFFNSAKLSITTLEIEGAAICRALLQEESYNYKEESKNYGIIDIGSKTTNMIVYSNKTIILSVSIPISGEDITNKISDVLEIKKNQAEKAKIVCGLDKTKAKGIISEILSDMIKNLNERIIDVLKFYSVNHSNLGPIQELILCGGGSYIKDLDIIISEATSIPTRKGDLLVNLTESKDKFNDFFIKSHNIKIDDTKNKKSQNLSIQQDTSLSYTTAVGLALRNIFIEKI